MITVVSGVPRSGTSLMMQMLAAALEAHLKQTLAWLERQPHMRICQVHYHRLLREPAAEVERVVSFLEASLDRKAMTAQIDPALHRQRL